MKAKDIPNILSISRIILSFVMVYLILSRQNIVIIVAVFGVAAITDFLDGFLARRYNWVSELGRKLDLVGDRLLWGGTALSFFIILFIDQKLTAIVILQIVMTMSREIITLPFAIYASFHNKHMPHTRYIGKVVTFFQGFALPSLILSIEYRLFMWLSIPLAIICMVVGIMSSSYYIKDTIKNN